MGAPVHAWSDDPAGAKAAADRAGKVAVATEVTQLVSAASTAIRPHALVMTPEVRAWLHDLRHRDRASAVLVGQAISMRLEGAHERQPVAKAARPELAPERRSEKYLLPVWTAGFEPATP
ncbi:MAG: hypothetical protein ACLPQY_09295 [Streptosporangiaceae bacterium]